METLSSLWNPYKYPVEHGKEVGSHNVEQCQLNVNIGLQLSACSTVLQTLTQAQIFDAYLYLISNESNTIVGIGESIVGLTALAILFPAASAVDRYDRGKVCDVAAYSAAIAAVLSTAAIWKSNIPLLFMSMLIWGFHWELCNSASDCIFVDSLPLTDRTEMITKKTVYQMVSCSIGISIQLCFFFIFGNTWSVGMCKVILSLGYIFITPIVIDQLFKLKDRRFIPVTPRELSFSESDPSETVTETDSSPDMTKPKNLTSPLLVGKGEKLAENDDWGIIGPGNDRDTLLLKELSPAQQCIPYLVGTSDFIRAIGAGMTVKFFALFFMNEYGFSPVHVTLLGVVYNMCIALFTEQANQMALRVGRTMTSLLYQIVSVILFLILYRTYAIEWVIIIYLIRGSAGNAFAALDRAIVADTTQVKNRGKWMAVESLSHVTWSGSAFIGGILSDTYDYRTTFLYTTFVYGLALAIYLPVAFLYPKSMDRIGCTQPTVPIIHHLSMSMDFDAYEIQHGIRTQNSVYQSRVLVDTMSVGRARGASNLAMARQFDSEFRQCSNNLGKRGRRTTQTLGSKSFC